MNIVIFTPVRLLADSLSAGLARRKLISYVEVVDTLTKLKEVLIVKQIDIVLIDVTQDVDWDELMALSSDFPDTPLWALSLEQQLTDVKQRGKNVFSGYVSRSSSIQELYQTILGLPDEHPVPSSR
jgi:DNA-binding NarL/FixJ family response regulator